MNIGRLRTLIEGKSDSELVFFAMYDRFEADEHIVNNEDDKTPLTDDEWIYVYTRMIEDEGIWTELNDSFRYYIFNVMENRAKGNADVNSK
jgi:hypothetical protein